MRTVPSSSLTVTSAVRDDVNQPNLRAPNRSEGESAPEGFSISLRDSWSVEKNFGNSFLNNGFNRIKQGMMMAPLISTQVQ